MHRLLYAVYEGPVVPPPLSGVPEEKEFHAILRRMKDEKPEPWYQKWAVGFGVTVLAGSAAALTLTLFDINPLDHIPGNEPSDPIAVASDPTTGEPVEVGADGTGTAGSSLRHAAQAYGRIVGGSATVTPDGAEEPSTSNTFGVGTKFEVSQAESLQVGLVGKMVANFSPGAEVTWATGSPSLIELEVDEGIAAIRYDRDQKDPILQIRTPNALVRVVGTVFTVQVDDESGTVVSVLRGQVDVLDPSSHRTVAEVESGYRYDVTKGTFDDVGKIEVQAALPVASVEESDLAAIPVSWNVPGLPQDATERTLSNVPARAGEPLVTVRSIRVMGTTGPADAPELPVKSSPRKVKTEGDDIIAQLMADAKVARRKELRQALRTCKDLYESHETRYRAATCFSNFLDKYDGQPAAAEAYAMLGLLRMDYALDYKAAEVALQTYLERAPNGVHAELALYRMWLCAVEDGRISQAIKRGSKYLDRYPNGRFVGNILQRFPELHSEIQ
jgi:TolA-binding protein